MKVALVHYWLTNMGGGEKVLLQLHQQYPDAPIFTSVYDEKALPEFRDADVRTTWLQKMPFRFKHQFFSALRPWAFKSFDLSDYDVVIISDAADAKNVRVPDSATSICYCHTPPRYFWSHYDSFMKNPGFGVLDPLIRVGLKVLVGPLRRIDFKAAQRVNYFIANSKEIQRRIKKYYQRPSEIIYPPVDVEKFRPPESTAKSGYIHLGRMIPMKRIDIVIEACNEMRLPLTVAGRGTEYQNLEKLAGPTVKMINNPSDQEVVRLMQESEAFLFAAEEDLGIVPVEAMAAATPVLAYNKGGATETVVAGKTGDFFDEQSAASLAKALKSFNPEKYSRDDLLAQAALFSNDSFRKKIKEFVDSKTRP